MHTVARKRPKEKVEVRVWLPRKIHAQIKKLAVDLNVNVGDAVVAKLQEAYGLNSTQEAA